MIFYFSGTGNTKGEELLYIPDLIRKGQYEYEWHEGERIGFCFPTHGWQPPGIVREFIRKLRMRGFGNPQLKASEFGNSEELPYCWALTTCGDNMGEAMTIFNKDLAKNTKLNVADSQPLQAETLFSVIMPESYVCLPFMKTDTEEKEAMKIELAKLQLPHIIQMIEERRRGIEELEKGATPRLYSYVIGGYFNKRMITDTKFTIDEDVCIKCGKCAKVCPVDNIKGTPPAWIHNGRCTCCLACYHHCPVHAINYGKITRKRGQYYFGRR